MIVRGFKSVIWVATVGGAALSCYMVSLQVATERAELAKVERQIIAAKREIRSLQTELGTRGRLSQLEQWNAEVLALAAPSSAQFLPSEVTLARFEKSDPTLDERTAQVRMAALDTENVETAATKAPVVQAIAPAPQPTATPVVHRASFNTDAPKAQLLAAPRISAKLADAKKSKPKAEPVAMVKAETKLPIKSAAAAPKAERKSPARSDPKTSAIKTSDGKVAAKQPADKVRASRIDTKLAAEIKTGLRKGQGSGGN